MNFRQILMVAASQPVRAAAGGGSYAAWPSLIGAEMMVNGDCSSGTGWGLPAGVVIAAGKMTATAADGVAASNDGVTPEGIMLEGATYRNVFTIDSRGGGSVQITMGSSGVGTSRSSVATFSEDIVAVGVSGSDGWDINFTSASMQLDNFSVKSVGGVGQSSDWSFAGGGEASFASAPDGIAFAGANQSDIASLTGSALTDFTAAVSFNTNVLVSFYVGSGLYGAGDIAVRVHQGSWVNAGIGADGWSTPVAVTTGSVAGFETRGNAGGTTALTYNLVDIDLA